MYLLIFLLIWNICQFPILVRSSCRISHLRIILVVGGVASRLTVFTSTAQAATTLGGGEGGGLDLFGGGEYLHLEFVTCSVVRQKFLFYSSSIHPGNRLNIECMDLSF